VVRAQNISGISSELPTIVNPIRNHQARPFHAAENKNPIPSATSKMAPRSRHTTPAVQTSAAPAPSLATPSKKSLTTTPAPKNTQDVQQIVQDIWGKYVEQTPQRTKLIDAFMAFLVVVGGLQFVYCVVAGNYVSSSFRALRCSSACGEVVNGRLTVGSFRVAVQCLPVGLQCHRWPVRAHCQLAHADESGEQGGV